ncbi:MAG: hypothetical protein AAB368_07830, partial [bacterium]
MVPGCMAHGWEEIPDVPVVPAVDRPDRLGPYRKDLDAHDLAYLDPSAYRAYPAARELVGANGPTLAWIAGPAPTGADRAAFTAKDHLFAPGARVEKSVVVINDRRAAVPYEASWRVTLGGRELAADTVRGTLNPAETRFLSVRFAVPGDLAVKTDGLLETSVRLGGTEHREAFGFRVVPAPAAAGGTVAVIDPAGDTAAWLRALGTVPRPWTPGDPVPAVLVVGRDALSAGTIDPASLEPLVRGGAAVLVMAQDADWLRARLGVRVSRHASRRVYPVTADHPALAGLDAGDLRDWAGASRAGPPYPSQDDSAPEPPYGWRWGGRGAVAGAALEIPHFGNWTPLAACEFDMAFSPLLELAHGRGHLMFCTFDLEDHVAADPAARRLAGNLLAYLRARAATPPAAAPGRAAFLGNAGDAAFLDSLGLVYDRVRAVPGEDRLLVASADARVPARDLLAFARRG